MDKATGFCKPCLDKGHSCEATAEVDGVWKCVFCEDDEPCPKDGRKTCRQPGCFLVLPKLNETGLCSGHEKQAADRAEKELRLAAKEAKAAAARAPKVHNVHKAHKAPNDSTIQREETPVAKEKEDQKFCSECGKNINSNNQRGICGPCRKAAKPPKRKSIGAQVIDQIAAPRKTAKPKIARTIAVTNGGNMQPTSVTQLATIEVSEAHLDKLWTGMSLLEKAAAITQSLRAGFL